MMATLKELSKQVWQGNGNNGDIDSGSLQRIADACELMAKDREKLIRDYEYAKEWKEKYYERWMASERKISAMKGVITKLKKANQIVPTDKK